MIYSGKTKYDIYVTYPEDVESKTEKFIKAVDEFSVEVGIQGFTLAWMKDGEYSEEDFPNYMDVKVLQSDSKSEKSGLTDVKDAETDKPETDSEDSGETVPVICESCLDRYVRHIVHEELANHFVAFGLGMFDVVCNYDDDEDED
jgi:hypothetical protein